MSLFFYILLLMVTCNATALTPEESCIMQAFDQPRIYAPWRSRYLESNTKGSCPFCAAIAANTDEKYLILRRFTHHIVILNLNPYSKGHLLIIPFHHTAKLYELSAEA